MVAGAHAYGRSGVASLIRSALDERRIVRFSEFGASPGLADVRRGMESLVRSGADRMVCIGGGSTIDLAKLVNYFAAAGISPESCLTATRSHDITCLELLAIPTTAGSGSEATRFAVLYVDRIKHSIEHRELKPSQVLLLPELTKSLSPYQAACSGFDVLAHAIESYWSRGATAGSRRHSLRALRLALSWLERNVRQPTAVSRQAMMRAAYCAGQAIDTAKTTAAHALSYSVTAHEHVPHGHAVALFLPGCLRWNVAHLLQHGSASQRRAMKQLLSILGASTVDDAVQRLRRLVKRIGLSEVPGLFRHTGKAAFAGRLRAEVNVSRLANNPVRLAGQDLEELVAAVVADQE